MDELRIVMMNGGLGNQLYQYAFLRFLEVNTGQKCWVDDSAFWGEGVEHNGYELERIFGIKLNLLSRFFSDDVWEEMMVRRRQGISIPQQLQDNGMNLVMIAEARDYSFDGNIINVSPAHINEGILNVFINAHGIVYYHGYFCNTVYFKLLKDILRKELVFPELKDTLEIDTINKRYAELIQITNSVAVHVRRGDFVQCGRVVSPAKYCKAIEALESKYTDCTYFVFSDDVAWCKVHEEELGISSIHGDVIYVEENVGNGNNYIDMQLMSQCKKMVISNSSFGIWAYYLNTNPDLELLVVDNL